MRNVIRFFKTNYISRKYNFIVLFYAIGVKKNLRVIFIVDCSQPSFESLVETHPAMYKYSDRIWMENWTNTSMATVASRMITQ